MKLGTSAMSGFAEMLQPNQIAVLECRIKAWLIYEGVMISNNSNSLIVKSIVDKPEEHTRSVRASGMQN